MRILIHSQHPDAGAGYAAQGRIIAPRLAGAGHEVAFVAAADTQFRMSEWRGFPVFPGSRDLSGSEAVAQVARHHWIPDIVLSIMDPWGLKLELLEGLRVVTWFPVDTTPVSAPTRIALSRPAIWDRLCYSAWGVKMLDERRDAEGDEADYLRAKHVPCMVQEEFRPGPSARAELGFPEDAYIIGCVGTNASGHVNRKGLPQLIMALAELKDEIPNVHLYLHTNDGEDTEARSLRLRTMARELGVEDRVIFPSQYAYRGGLFTAEGMRKIYSSLDLYCGPSMAEGFGVPLIEAQACGIPVLTSGWTSMPELVEFGAVIPPEHSEPIWVGGFNAFQRLVRVRPLVDAIKAMHAEDARWKDPGERVMASARIRRRFDPDVCFETYWTPLLHEWEHAIDSDGRCSPRDYWENMDDTRPARLPTERDDFGLE